MTDATGQETAVRAATIVALDAGQTGTRARFGAAEGSGPGVVHLGAPDGVPQLARALCTAAESAGAGVGAADVVCAGLSGFADDPARLEALAAAVMDRLGAGRVVLAGDMVTAFLGALGGRPGVVLAAGTGSVVLAGDGHGALARVDGAGPLLGDAGSGFAIGRAGLESALRDLDGRGGSAALRRRAEAAFGPLERLPAAIYDDGPPAGRIAAFAPAVADAARSGDPAAVAIFSQAAEELAHSVAAAATRVFGPGAAADVSWTGGLFRAGELLAAPFQRALAARAPALRLRPPAGSNLDGAALLAAPGAVERFPNLAWSSA
jgi:N-acetylglucosamine kinase-like BadF-type ATPase